ncbi:VOC family protein [Litorimonas sp. RW-G-Af-16]|uniref:VOC family protein n=1 Tax=Litorimonas sp. RW-G-Af-16 TaxID=3241168 RepID=UPI00390C5667
MPTAPKPKPAIFHLAYPIKDKEATRTFYRDILGCHQGREAPTWIDFDFFGHQLSFHLKPESFATPDPTNQVDGKDVPVRHFGAVLPWNEWHALRDRLIEAGTEFVIKPYIRFKGETGEQATMFFLDPSGNALEFKSFKDPSQIFAA